MIKIVPFIIQGIDLEPIIYNGLDFIFNPNQIIKLKKTDPLSMFLYLSNQGYSWYIDFNSATDSEAYTIQKWHNLSFTSRLTRAFKEGKPIVLFEKTHTTKGLDQNQIKDLMFKIIGKVKSKQSVGIVKDDDELVII